MYVGDDYACERRIIERYAVDLISISHSRQKQIDSLNLLAFNMNQQQTVSMNMRCFSQMVYILKLIEMDVCLGSDSVNIPKEFDLWVWQQYSINLLRIL